MHELVRVRTTLDIDSDLLEVAKEISSKTKRTTGQVVSELIRKALTSPSSQAAPVIINGFEQLPSDGRVITPEFVRKLMEESDTP
jgi:hypothetical protein